MGTIAPLLVTSGGHQVLETCSNLFIGPYCSGPLPSPVATTEIHTVGKCTLQEHQMIPTNATVSKDSDKLSISVIMAVYENFFFTFFK